MTEDDPRKRAQRARRILVALDAISDYQRAISRAAAMAADMHAELAAMFVEDMNLLNLCDLPGQQVLFGSGRVSNTGRAEMERQMKARAAAARASLEHEATARRLTWSFEVHRGRLIEAVVAAAKGADVVSVEYSGPGLAQAVRAIGPGCPVVAYYEGGEGGARMLRMAARLAAGQQAPLLVLIPAADAAASRPLVDAALAELNEARATGARLERVAPGMPALAGRMKASAARLMLVDAHGEAAQAANLQPALAAARCEVLLVGGP